MPYRIDDNRFPLPPVDSGSQWTDLDDRQLKETTKTQENPLDLGLGKFPQPFDSVRKRKTHGGHNNCTNSRLVLAQNQMPDQTGKNHQGAS